MKPTAPLRNVQSCPAAVLRCADGSSFVRPPFLPTMLGISFELGACSILAVVFGDQPYSVLMSRRVSHCLRSSCSAIDVAEASCNFLAAGGF
jgi:hypothetical protein